MLRLAGSRVLVVGANTGQDCRYFKDWGAAEVHGLDVLEYTGADYQAPGVTYHIESAEAMSLASDYFDLVYCFATMEHIPQIDRAFREMARVTRPGGVIYCIAAPLWNSRFGHHKGNLFPEPWIHLRMTRDEIVDFSHKNGIDAPDGIETHVDYMLDPANMNQVPARRYVEVCKSLPRMKILRNDLECEPPEAVPPDVLSELASRGYAGEELRAVTHVYIGKKRSIKGRMFGWLSR